MCAYVYIYLLFTKLCSRCEACPKRLGVVSARIYIYMYAYKGLYIKSLWASTSYASA
jgi:hypothetical protein